MYFVANFTPMEKGYIILAHKLSQQLYRLIDRLDDNQSTFYVHIDKKKNINDFNNLSDFGNKVCLVKRANSNWGEMGIVTAVLNAFKAIKASQKKLDRIILLSGQDYPIKSNNYINEFFASSPYKVFIKYWPMPNYKIWKKRGGMYRFDKYFLGLKRYQKFISKSLNFIGILFPFLKREMPYKLKPYGGWQWWIIDMYALNYILKFLNENPKYLRYHKYTFVPDEVFFQTILLNSKDKKLLASITNDDMRFIQWKKKSHPETLDKSYLQNLMESEHLFARKFDTGIDSKILDLIDENCLNNKVSAMVVS